MYNITLPYFVDEIATCTLRRLIGRNILIINKFSNAKLKPLHSLINEFPNNLANISASVIILKVKHVNTEEEDGDR